MGKVLATPGVYIEEKSAFASSAVPVATAVPAFIGYTEKALRGTKPLHNKPTRITSLGQYKELFGGAPKTKFVIAADETVGYTLEINKNTHFLLYNAMRFFFMNGGSTCYVCSIGTYDYDGGIKASVFNDIENEVGIPTLLKEPEPTMLVIPEAIQLEKDDCYGLQQSMIKHCGYDMQSRFALLDVFDGTKERTFDEEDIISQFRNGVGSNFLAYAASYYPWLNTTVTQSDEVGFVNVENLDGLAAILNSEVDNNPAFFDPEGNIKPRGEAIKVEIAKLETVDVKNSTDVTNLANTLAAVSPMFKDICGDMRDMINVLPPSAGMAGVYSMVDNAFNVARAPAGVSMGSVISPVINITNENQEDLNLPLTGKAVNAIRSFPGKGTLVWGARTLDGNSQDWRYINVRRAVIYLEQSIKIAADAYVFEPNVAGTWVSIKSMITNFLNSAWQGGILAGSSPDDAFSVDVGLGSTMTANDILDGIMRITVKIAVTRPAEFIVITFQQQQQKS